MAAVLLYKSWAAAKNEAPRESKRGTAEREGREGGGCKHSLFTWAFGA